MQFVSKKRWNPYHVFVHIFRLTVYMVCMMMSQFSISQSNSQALQRMQQCYAARVHFVELLDAAEVNDFCLNPKEIVQ